VGSLTGSPALRLALGLALGLTACTGAPPETDAARYQRVLGDATMSAEEALPICESLTSASARGDCGLVVAYRAASVDPEGAAEGAICERVEAGTWRQECYFQTAEALARKGQREAAAALCLSAGPFRDDCGQHLWQTQVHTLLQGAGAAGFARAMPRAREIYAAWEPLLGEQTDFRDRFWRRFYHDGFSADPPPFTLAPCDALAAEDRARCEQHGLDLYLSRVRQIVGRSLCMGGRPTRPEVAAVEDPRIDIAIAEEMSRLCR